MPDFWSDLDVYERGGVAGPSSRRPVLMAGGGGIAPPAGAPAPAPAPGPAAQPGPVMHNGYDLTKTWTRQGVRDTLAKYGAPTAEHLAQAVKENPWLGQQVGRGDIKNPRTGEIWDVIGNEATGNGHWQTLTGHTSPTAQRGPMMNGAASLTARPGPMNFASGSPAGAPVLQAAPSTYTSQRPDAVQYEDFQAPDPFKAPSLAEAQNDPGFQFGLNEGLDTLSNRAAAQGIRGGDVLKDFNKFATDYASTKYGDVYNRARDAYSLNSGMAFQANQANNAGRLGAFNANVGADLGYGGLDVNRQRTANDFTLGQGSLALGNRNADITRELGLGNIGLGYHRADQDYALGQGNIGLGYGQLGLGYANYGLNADAQRFHQDYEFPIGVGFDAARTTGGYGTIYGQNGQENAYGVGNARAAGATANGSAWANTTGRIGGYIGGMVLDPRNMGTRVPPPDEAARVGFGGY